MDARRGGEDERQKSLSELMRSVWHLAEGESVLPQLLVLWRGSSVVSEQRSQLLPSNSVCWSQWRPTATPRRPPLLPSSSHFRKCLLATRTPPPPPRPPIPLQRSSTRPKRSAASMPIPHVQSHRPTHPYCPGSVLSGKGPLGGTATYPADAEAMQAPRRMAVKDFILDRGREGRRRREAAGVEGLRKKRGAKERLG